MNADTDQNHMEPFGMPSSRREIERSAGRPLAHLADPVVTLGAVQQYVEAERNRARRVLLWTSGIFLLVVGLILVLFISVGIYVLHHSRKAAELAGHVQARTMMLASEAVAISNSVRHLNEQQSDIHRELVHVARVRDQETQVMKADLVRFGKWVESRLGGNGPAMPSTLSDEELESVRRRLAAMEIRAEQREAELRRLQEGYRMLLTNQAAGVSRSPSPLQAVPAATVDNDIPDVAAAVPSVPPVRPVATAAVAERVVAPPASPIKTDTEIPEELAGEAAEWNVPLPERPSGLDAVSQVTFSNGDRYEGELVNGLFSGWGVYEWHNGDRYEGQFDQDMRHGRGRMQYRNGDVYHGPFEHDLKHGRGMLVFHNGDRYTGDFVEDRIEGKGTLLYRNGNRYTGDFVNGLRQGQGELRFFNGDVYEGRFEEDRRTGTGTYVFADGGRYIGGFLDGRRHGQGRYIYPSGEEFLGTFEHGSREGPGRLIYPTGEVFEGVWEDDRPRLAEIEEGA